MRRLIFFAMAVLFLSTILVGIAESHVHPGSAGHHIIASIVFSLFLLTHLVLNRKSIARYITALID
jgi:hypothetical protein